MNILDAATTLPLGDVTIPFLGRGNIWVDSRDSLSVPVVQSLMLSAVQATAPGQVEMVVYDEALTGLAAPFMALGEGAHKVLRIVSEKQELLEILTYLRHHIQGVRNVMRGEADTLVGYRRLLGYPVEGYTMVVLSADFSSSDDGSSPVDKDVQTRLTTLFAAGPAAGVSFLVHAITDGVNEPLLKTFHRLRPWKGSITWQPKADWGEEKEPPVTVRNWSPPAAADLIGAAEHVARQMATAAIDPIPFDAVQALETTWAESSADGVSFAIGRYGRDIVRLTLGDEVNQRHNMLVTGAVGQGKSNLLTVIIHSICQRYAPDEVELYLLDFKEGVTLQPLVDRATGEYLPHARVLGLEADREFGLSVFRRLHEIYRERMRVFKENGVQGIREYRHECPAAVMPRIVLVIDEFQMMFAERDRVSDEIADLLIRGVRLFRACGIHVVLASQTIGGGNLALMGSAGEGLFGQVPIRVALKNSLSESYATLSQKNDAATHLRVGEAIVNEDYGEPQANRKTTIALADKAMLAGLRRRWWENRGASSAPPSAFEGSVKRSLADDGPAIRQARLRGVRRLFLGSRIEVGGRPLAVDFGREVGRNVVVLGAGDVVPQIESMVLSLAVLRPYRFVVLPLDSEDAAWEATKDMFLGLLEAAGSTVELVAQRDIAGTVAGLADSLAARSDGTPDVVVVGLGLDRMRDLPPEFSTLAHEGPAAGVHLIGWWRKLDTFREHTGFSGGMANFDIRMTLKLDPLSASDLMGDRLLAWRAADNRMLAWDAADMPAAVTVIPYRVVDPATVRALLPAA